MKRGQLKRGKPLRRESKKRAAARREAKATFGAATGPCEMLPFLGGVRAWHSWVNETCGNNWTHPAFHLFDTHHVFGSRWHDEPWNRMAVCRVAHKFEDECFGTAGFVVCLMALERRGDLMSDEFYLDRLGWSPLGKVSNWIDDGLFLADAAKGIVGEPVLRKYAEQLCGLSKGDARDE